MLAITGGTVYTITGRVLEKGTVLIEDDKITDVGVGIDIPSRCEVIDASGKLVLPGFIDAHCHVGIMEEIYSLEGDDGNETTNPVTPHLRAIDAINPSDIAFTDALFAGVTAVVVTPGSANVLGGEMVALKTKGTVADRMVIKNPVGVKAALGENPKRVYGGEKKTPATRMANAALLRQTLVETINYMRRESKERDLKYESLVPVIKRELPLRIHAHRADDIMTAVRIAEEFDIKIVIEHCTEGYKVADLLAEKKIPVIIGPIITNRAKVELQGVSLKNAAVLYQAGVKFAVMTDHPVVPVQYLSLSAALTIRAGLPEEEALRAITINPAAILGLSHRLGSLEPGKDADIVILDRPFYDIRCRVEQVFVNGRKILPQN
ncbi:imidazolonepropionase-like amidohydrolase [Desulfohalotomaculum tongense]|uniref:amidohydrolase n=1 Tax=Desulforadius tongensis TaxID=1216062 RepID=UPI0019575AAA|nr:amidohydrolase [Desulforadius tongensis]MBM7855359.1 imidazolonepropionase-like amidohydrolase [Desulforadius tongensis]